jgi:hypothetical protein
MDAIGRSVKRRNAVVRDFARGPAELASALFEKRRPYISADFSLHVTEVALAINNSSLINPSYETQSTFAPLGPLQALRF